MASIRPAIDADLDPLGRIHVRAWRESYRGLLPDDALDRMSAEAAAEDWRRTILAGRSLLFVTQEGPRLLGYGSCGRQRSATLRRLGYSGEVETLYLLRAAHGRGLGRALMAEMAEALLAWGFSSLALWVLAANEHARGFYAHLGGRPVARRLGRWEGRPTDEVAYGWRHLGELRAAA